MSAREILAYAITHAPKGVKGGPYEADLGAEPVASLEDAWRTPAGTVERARSVLKGVRARVPHARVIRIVRARPSEASTLETARRRLAAVAEHMTEHAYQELASALDVDACRAGPSEASAVEVLRGMLESWDERGVIRTEAFAEARRIVLAASGPDPSEVVRDLVMLVAGELDYDLAKSLEPATAEEPREAERTMRDAVKCVTERFVVARKAGGK